VCSDSFSRPRGSNDKNPYSSEIPVHYTLRFTRPELPKTPIRNKEQHLRAWVRVSERTTTWHPTAQQNSVHGPIKLTADRQPQYARSEPIFYRKARRPSADAGSKTIRIAGFKQKNVIKQAPEKAPETGTCATSSESSCNTPREWTYFLGNFTPQP